MDLKAIAFITSSALTAQSLFLAVPLLCSLICGEDCSAFLVTAVICLAAAAPLYIIGRKRKTIRSIDGFAGTAFCWIALSLTGMLPFLFENAVPSAADAFFETVSAFTTTGASVIADVESLSHGLLFWRSFMHWIGGMGILVFMMAFSGKGGSEQMNLMKAESPGPVISKLLPRARDTAKVLYQMYMVLTAVTTAVFIISGIPVFDSFCLSFGAAGTGGFAVLNSGCASYTMIQQTLIATACMLFGVNFGFYFFIIKKKFRLAGQMDEVKVYAALIVSAVISVAFILNGNGLCESFGSALHTSYFQVCSIITTTGYSVSDMNVWPLAAKIVIITVMLTGACAGSTGGGFKVSRVLLMVKSFIRECAFLIRPGRVKRIQMDSKAVDENVIRNTGAYLFTAFMIMLASAFIIALNECFDAGTVFSSVLACFNNIGPGFGECGSFGNYAGFSHGSKLLLSLDMMLGRLELFPLTVLLCRDTWRRF